MSANPFDRLRLDVRLNRNIVAGLKCRLGSNAIETHFPPVTTKDLFHCIYHECRMDQLASLQ